MNEVSVAVFILTVILTFGVRRLALYLKIVDTPDQGRKRHQRPVALWGGLPIWLAFWGALAYVYFIEPRADMFLLWPVLYALFIASLIYLLLGLADDFWTLSFGIRLPFLVVATLLVAIFAPVEKITNPAGGYFLVDPLLGIGLVFFWLMLTTISVKILDGVDGLATSIGLVGALSIAALTLTTKFYQPNVAYVALSLAAALAGFLVFNLPPARIFLGEAGSLFVGLMLGGLSIMAGSKIATGLLVMAVPVLDLLRVMFVRWRAHQPIFGGDRSHLHFVLIDRGWREWQVLAFLVGLAVLFGWLGLWLQSYQKLVALLLVGVGFLLFAVALSFKSTQSKL
ncbi:MAG: MraY family glycosyltransferase [Candidatus Magasanikbacteria bacterium]|nr:MraY family glycosyltransferase [Candidatus Magasanikbacteria bacterium]